MEDTSFERDIGQRIILPLIISILVVVPFLPALLRAGATGSADSSKSVQKITEISPYPTGLWIASQFIPSPEWFSTRDNGLRFGMRWQVTPVLYSIGINRRLNPWRFLVVEPIIRQNGSVEWFLTPEWLNLTDKFSTNWLFRTGLRGYLPLYRFGEYLSASLAASYYNFNGINGISYEAGLYIFFGILGLQATYSPDMTDVPWIFTLRLRYF